MRQDERYQSSCHGTLVGAPTAQRSSRIECPDEWRAMNPGSVIPTGVPHRSAMRRTRTSPRGAHRARAGPRAKRNFA